MRRRLTLFGSLLALSGLLAFPACSQQAAVDRVVPGSAGELRLSFAPVVRDVAPAVVNITAERMQRGMPRSPLMADPFFRRFFDLPVPERRQTSLGSGVIVDPAGRIVTNTHVIEGAEAITVVLADRREFPARVIRTDATADIALLQIETGRERLPALDFADSDRLEVGDLVLAIGNPFGIGQSVSSGIVSATARSARGLDLAIPLIQTDAAINPGNSGGALVDLDGRLVGVNTAILTRSGGSIGVGFAIPASYVRAFVRRGLTTADAPWLGARLQPVDVDLAEALGLDRPRGALLRTVHPAGAAARAGLAQGDVLLTLDGVPVDDEGGVRLRLAVAETPVDAEVWRRGEVARRPLELVPAPREPEPDPERLGRGHPLAGLTVANLSPAFALEHGLDPFTEGVVVTAVDPGGAAARIGFRPRDVIIELAGVRVRNRTDVDSALRGHRGPLWLVLERGGRRLQVVLS
ncbi:MAG: trypsin-like peptidase domain-containing protein [Pseudomonadota bacterium]